MDNKEKKIIIIKMIQIIYIYILIKLIILFK